jgi:hypothetical protein
MAIKYSTYLTNNIVGRRHIKSIPPAYGGKLTFDPEQLRSMGQKTFPPVLKSPEGTFSLYSTLEEVIMAQGAPDFQKKITRQEELNWYDYTTDQSFHPRRAYDVHSSILQYDPLINRGYLVFGGLELTLLQYGTDNRDLTTPKISEVLLGSMPDCRCRECESGKYVIAWADFPGKLKLADFRSENYSMNPDTNAFGGDAFLEALTGQIIEQRGLNYGMSIEQVLISQGNPKVIIPEYPVRSGNQMVTPFDNLDRGTLRFYYWGDLHLPASGVVFSPRIRLLTRVDELDALTKQGIEWAKIYKRATIELIEQTVVGFTNPGHLTLGATESLEAKKGIIQKEQSLRWLDMLELQDLFTSIKEQDKAQHEEIGLEERKQENKAIKAMQEFLDSTVNSSTYDKGIGLELFSKRLLEAMGWQIEHSGKSGDGGVDLVGFKSDNLMTMKIVIQCKHQDSVAEDVVVQTFGKAQSENADRAYVITSGKFTANAKAFADANENKTVLIDGIMLKDLSAQYLDT